MNIEDIRSLKPCYDPSKYLSESWQGSVQDILRMKNIPPQDRLWACCNEGFIAKDILFKFAENCCWQIVNTLPDNKQLEYCNILCILRFARDTNDKELRIAAGYAAWYAAGDEARDATRSAAESAAGYAAESAAGCAAWYAARSADGSAAGSAAGDELCFMLADMIEGVEFNDDNMYLLSRLEEIKEGEL